MNALYSVINKVYHRFILNLHVYESLINTFNILCFENNSTTENETGC